MLLAVSFESFLLQLEGPGCMPVEGWEWRGEGAMLALWSGREAWNSCSAVNPEERVMH